MTAKARILLIGYRQFSELINSVLPEFEQDAEVIIEESVASRSIDYEALVHRHQPDVVASAGSNAVYLEKALSLPVIAQPVTETDLIEAIARARRIGERVHLFTFTGLNSLSSRLFDALPALSSATIRHDTYATTDEAAEKLYAAIASEAPDVVVGPSYICHLAKERGLPTCLIYSKDSARALIEKALQRSRSHQLNRNRRAPGEGAQSRQFVVYSPQMTRVAQLAKTYARGSAAVLLQGESGTGKEHIAREIHRESEFHNGNLVAVNCGGIPSELFESELFGYVDGAFTSSRRGGREGLVARANGGVLYLDEIGEMPLDQQVKLLRVLQEKCVRPVGSTREIPLNFKVIAATNTDLEQAVGSKHFRDDLYYRLNVFRLEVPPLRARPTDIRALTEHYLRMYAASYQVPCDPSSTYDCIGKDFEYYRWPGNVRELQNFCERLIVNLASGSALGDLDVAEVLPELGHSLADTADVAGLLQEQELRAITGAMRQFNGDKSAVCRELGISQTTLWRRLKHIESLNEGHGPSLLEHS
ncbi:MAG: sigma 54-interacting transcriptional regulator [Pseudomonadota bacterium]